MAGISRRARTTAHPIRWVKLTFPPLVSRRSWLLRILRLTSRSLAGIVRTEVAVGTDRLSSIRRAIVPVIPLRGTASGDVLGVSGSAFGSGPRFGSDRSAGAGATLSSTGAGWEGAGVAAG